MHVGFALGKVDEAEATRTYKLLEELRQLNELDTPDPELGVSENTGGTFPAVPVARQSGSRDNSESFKHSGVAADRNVRVPERRGISSEGTLQ